METSRQKFIALIQALSVSSAANPTPDPEMVELFNMFQAKKIRFADGNIFSVKDGGGKSTLNLFETKDVKTEGLTNVDKSRLEKDQFFLITSIQLLAITHSEALTNELLKGGLAYDSIHAIAPLANGNSTFKIKSKEVIKDFNNYSFVQENNQQVRVGEYVLDNPQLIRSQDLIEFDIKTGVALPTNTAVKVVFNGTMTLPS